MENWVNSIAKQMNKARQRERRRQIVIGFLAILVVFCTGYALSLPAITMERKTLCGLDEHIHTEACYTGVPTLVCGLDEQPGHAHSEDCFTPEGELVCGQTESEGHTHDESCYSTDFVLTCQLQEHVHTEDCYAENEEDAGEFAAFTAEMNEEEPADPIIMDVEPEEEFEAENEEVFLDETAEDLEPEAEGEAEAEGTEEESETEEEKEELVSMPAQSFHVETAEVAVSVEADEGTFPADTYMTVVPVKDEAILDAAADTVDSEINSICAVDICFFNNQGEEIQPLLPIRVTMTSSVVRASEDTVVVHVDDEGTASQVENVETGEGDVSFETDSFSVYVLVGTVVEKTIEASDGRTYKISVTFQADADLPKGADIAITEFGGDAYLDYVGRSSAAMGASGFEYARVFDISIIDANGEKVQPSAQVDVTVTLLDAEDTGTTFSVVHFADEGDGEETQCLDSISEGNTVSFQTDSFSAYAIVQGPAAIPSGWYEVSSIEELISRGSKGLYIGHKDGYYFCNELDDDGSRIGIKKTKPAQSTPPTDRAAKYYFEQVSGTDNQVYVYCYALDGVTKQYVYNGNNNSLSYTTEESRTAFTVTRNSDGTFMLNNGEWYWNMQRGAAGTRFCAWNSANDVNNKLKFWYYDEIESEPYGLDGKAYGLMNWNGGVAGKAMMASEGGDGTLDAKPLTVMSTEDDKKQLFVPNDSDISMWTFSWVSDDLYHLSAVSDGSTKYLKIDESGLHVVSDANEASEIQVIPGTGVHAGEICLKSGSITLSYSGSVENGFTVGGTVGNEWLKLVELSELTTEYFLTYSAAKVGVSDESITNGSRIIVYTRSWNEEKLRYEYYAISSDGKVVPVYENGGSIEWVSGQINTLLWNFVEYYWEGTNDPNFYYELYNQYSEKYIAPQITGEQILSDDTIGINLNGRRDGQYYSTILAWDEESYSYAGLKVENGKIVTCPAAEAMDFYFAVMQDLNVDDDLTTVPTVEHTQYGITMRLINYNGATGNYDGSPTTTEQHDVMGNSTFNQWNGVKDLLSTNLVDGYPTATLTNTSLSRLFGGAVPVDHLFIQSTYDETGYFAFDSTQNFASLQGSNFVVYNELGTMDNGNKDTLKHGQFMPYNDLEAGVFASVNPKNIRDISAKLLPDSDPRKNERLYLVRDPDYYYGMELEASFTQTPSGLDAWGHDIIFEFTGDDDFWLYVDGELVLDLGGIHSALGGSVNYRTGVVVENGKTTDLRTVFENNYRERNPGATQEDVDAFLLQYFDEGSTVFRDETTHHMKMFYMERGAGASNLKMRFNLAAVKKGTVQLTKELTKEHTGVDESNILTEFPYQIFYQTEDGTVLRLTNALPDDQYHNIDYVLYHDSINPVKYSQSLTIDGTTYEDVFFLKPGETADISFPEGIVSYRIVECGVNTEVYSSVTANGDLLEGIPVGEGSTHSDYGIDYTTTDLRPKVKYVNDVNPEALRTLTIKKMLYREDGETPIPATEDGTEFSFRLYLASEFDELDLANMHAYHVKDPDGCYCRWDKATQTFVKIGDGVSDWILLNPDQKKAATFTTSIYGVISRIRSGYTVEIRNVLAGTKYRVEERPADIPDGYSFQKYDEFENNGAAEIKERTGVRGVNGTVVASADPKVTVRNLKGWGLRVNKIWRDKDYMDTRDPVYFALFTGEQNPVMVPDSLRQIPYEAKPQTLYWYYDRLPVDGTTSVQDYFIREVTISSANPTVDSDGVVSNYGDVTPIAGGNSLLLSGRQKGEEDSSIFTYTVLYDDAQIIAGSNVQVVTVTNDRPGLILKKTDWSGNPLEGAVFTLADSSSGAVLGTFSSDADGLITIAFLSNNKDYVLTETSVQRPFRGLDNPITINISNGTVSVSGPDTDYYVLTQAQGTTLASLTVKNRPYTFQAVKQDADTKAPLAGVHFALHKQVTVGDVTAIDLNPMPGYEDLVTDGNGILPMLDNSLPAGTYELREKTPLDGYDPLSAYIRFTISPTGAISLGTHPDGVTLSEEAGESDALACVLTILNYQRKKVSFQKVDIGNPNIKLEGAVFDLYALEEDGETEQIPALYTGLTSGSDGLLRDSSGNTVFELPLGNYHLKETTPPAGYQLKAKAVEVRVTAQGISYDEGSNLSQNGTGVSYNSAAGTYTLTVTNTTGYALPSTGGSGTDLLYLLGGMLILLAGAALLIDHRRMKM